MSVVLVVTVAPGGVWHIPDDYAGATADARGRESLCGRNVLLGTPRQEVDVDHARLCRSCREKWWPWDGGGTAAPVLGAPDASVEEGSQ